MKRGSLTKNSNRLSFLSFLLLIICVIAGFMGVVYIKFENMTDAEELEEPAYVSFEESGIVEIKKIYLDDSSILEPELTKLFNGHATQDHITLFDEMFLGYSLDVTIATAFVTAIEIYANDIVTEYSLEVETFPTTFWPSIFGFTKPQRATTKGTTTELGFVSGDLCNMDSTSCSICASKTISEFSLQTEHIESPFPQHQWRRDYIQGSLGCGSESKVTQKIKLNFNNNQIRPTEITIYGQEIVEEEVRKIKIHRATEEKSDEVVSGTISKAVDHKEGSTLEDCFVAEGPVGRGSSWASLEIAWSKVTHVNLLTMRTGTSDDSEGIWVDVCSYGRECLPCEILTMTAKGEWGGVYCLGGLIPGNEVQLRHAYEPLVLCEVEIFGKTAAKGTQEVIQMLQVVNSYETPIGPSLWVGLSDMRRTLSLMYDNFWTVSVTSCYETYEMITFQVATARIHYVKMLSFDFGRTGDDDFLFNTRVDICGRKETVFECHLCGYVSNNSSSTWVTVMCPRTGLVGDQVKVSKEYGKILSICEVEVYGEQFLAK